MYYVYVLISEKDGKFYIGQTQDIEQRLEAHNRGKVRVTRYRRPFHKSLKGGNEFKKILGQAIGE